ncbi:pyruvate kinase [Salpingoeca rosetta]|uniref:Pyruvate kinase n=1 Tax=Salpingoeca rosetta (strain ATCC 50818 / BSB-021) TaxID=946362 RepID=F2TWM6_SALR5|nr:pyruvate kinase [Salpingoeca rosetta]EGD72472.1 pyruvate kinase [Salpingoeca rosetta]|eukprot:XP_004999041.1 pyruvate kinase [Salpingoeca rosetta]
MSMSARSSKDGVLPGQLEAHTASTDLELRGSLSVYSEPIHQRKTGIICTIGPVSRSVEKLRQLMEAGLCIVRLNFSHGDHAYHAETIANAREAAKQMGKPIAIALDTKGPEIRTGLLEGSDKDPRLELDLVAGEHITVTTDPAFKASCCTKDTLYLDYKNITKVMQPGNQIYVDDGLISLRADAIEDKNIKCTILNSGKLGSRKGCNLPNVNVDLPAVSEKDHGDLLFGVEQNVDIVFASFIRSRADIRELRKVLGDKGKHVLIIAKIENHQGIQNFDEILSEADGIMVARGDLGIEIPAEKVFLAQKMMIAKCNMAGKPVICATQMLESMVHAPRPTRAEGSDVANAVLDGADCVMLSGETAKGDYPVEAVKMMASICTEAESAVHLKKYREELRLITPRPTKTTETCSVAAVDASVACNAAGIICLTISGRTARLLSKWKPKCPIIGVTRTTHVSRQMHLYHGVHPLYYRKQKVESWSQDVDNRFFWAMERGKKLGILKSGDTIIGVHGWQTGPGHTNTVRILLVQ